MQPCANGEVHFDPSSVEQCLRQTGEAEISWEEFLQLLEVEEGLFEETLSRVEYREGKAIVSKPMPTSSHRERLGALYLLFINALAADGKYNFTVYQEHNVFMLSRSYRISRKPDLLVRCFNDAEERRMAGNRDADPEQGVEDPVLMVEVLSKGNTESEMNRKRDEYLTRLPSLREYYEVSNSDDSVHVWRRMQCDSPWEHHVMDEEGIHSFVIERRLTPQEFVDASAARWRAQWEENERSQEKRRHREDAERQREEERRHREDAERQREDAERQREEERRQQEETERQREEERRQREEAERQREMFRKLLREEGIPVAESGEEV